MPDPMTPDAPPRPNRRGALLLLGGLAAAAAILPPVVRRVAPLDTAPIEGLPGFRRIDGEGLSRAFDPLVGLGAPDAGTLPAPAPDASPAPDAAALDADFCAALFPGWSGDSVPLALFSDINCAVCRRTEPALLNWVDERGGRVTVHWQELPILGPTSVVAARAVLAAEASGRGDDARVRLRRSAPAPGPDWMSAFGESLGLEGNSFAAAAYGPEVDRRIATSLALARRLGLPGTPGAVLGRTLAVGALSAERWTRLLGEEDAAATRAACAEV
jgi:protein-disulfide isomerase